MKLKSKIFLLFIILIILVSCSNNQKQIVENNQQMRKNTISKIELPWYIANTPQNNSKIIYGIGSGSSLEGAVASAKESISSFYKLYVENQYQGYEESNQINNQEYYQEYISHQKKLLSNLNIPGITIVETDRVDKQYYALASLEKEILERSQRDIRYQIEESLNRGVEETNPGLKLQSYYLAASLLSKLIEPVEYQGKLAFNFIAEETISIFENIKIDYFFTSHSRLTEYQGLVVSIKSNMDVLSGIPMSLGNVNCYPDNEGRYYLKSKESSPYNLMIKVAVDNLKLSPELQGREIADARKLISLLTPFEQNLYIIPPVEITAYLDLKHFVNNEVAGNNQLLNQVKQYLLQNNISLTDYQKDANMILSISTYCDESSYNQYLGFAYKAGGTISFKGVNKEIEVRDLNDNKTREKTKSFAQQKIQAVSSATEILNDLIIEELKKIRLK